MIESRTFASVPIYKFRNLHTGQAMPIPPGEFVVGRDEKAYVHVVDGSVSRKHAKIVNDGENVFVEDTGSSNGTAIRGGLIKKQTVVVLGDIVYIGSVPFRVDPEVGGDQVPAAPASISTGLRPVNRGYVTKDTDRIPFSAVESAVRASEVRDNSIVPERRPTIAANQELAKPAAGATESAPLQKAESAQALPTGDKIVSRVSPSPSVPTRVSARPPPGTLPPEPKVSVFPAFLIGMIIGLLVGFIVAKLF